MTENQMLLVKSMLVGQQHAVDVVASVIKIHTARLNDPLRPAGSFFLAGPSGVGKTSLVEALAVALHGTRRHCIKVNCGEYMLEHEVAKLIGAPPGYLGHRETTPVFNAAKLNAVTSEKCGLSIILFDEIEKAALSFQRIMLSILDKGELSLGDGTKLSFMNSLIFFTSNLGLREFYKNRFSMGLHKQERPLESFSFAEYKKLFSTEFRNRIDHLIHFKELTREDYGQIFDIQLSELHDRLAAARKNLSVIISPEAKEYIINKSVTPEFGARELRRVMQQELIAEIAATPTHLFDTLTVTLQDGKLEFDWATTRKVRGKAAV